MNDIIKSRIALVVAVVGIVGGILWIIQVGPQLEPLMLVIISAIEILGYFIIPTTDAVEEKGQKIQAKQNVSVHVNLGGASEESKELSASGNKFDRSKILDAMFMRTTILFIDDDHKFNMVKILKDSGWKKTKTVVDIKSLDMPAVRDADIIFVDINGVGKLLKLENEGLDLALMLKQKYRDKKIVIYSANRNSNSFHPAWDLCDFKLEKNALPYQFQNLVEEYSIEKYRTQ